MNIHRKSTGNKIFVRRLQKQYNSLLRVPILIVGYTFSKQQPPARFRALVVYKIRGFLKFFCRGLLMSILLTACVSTGEVTWNHLGYAEDNDDRARRDVGEVRNVIEGAFPGETENSTITRK
jgi:hypothetical protein